MAIEETIYSTVTDDAGVTALVAARVYPVKAPQAATAPYVTYRRISDDPHLTHGNESNTGAGRFQFDCYGSGYSQTKSVAAALRTALNGQRVIDGNDQFVALTLGEVDLPFESELNYYRTTIDFRVIYCDGGG